MVQQIGNNQSFLPVRARRVATLLDDHRYTRGPSKIHETAYGNLMRLRSLLGAHPETVRGHRGVKLKMPDDVLIHGATEEEHQHALLATLKKLEDAY